MADLVFGARLFFKDLQNFVLSCLKRKDVQEFVCSFFWLLKNGSNGFTDKVGVCSCVGLVAGVNDFSRLCFGIDSENELSLNALVSIY